MQVLKREGKGGAAVKKREKEREGSKIRGRANEFGRALKESSKASINGEESSQRKREFPKGGGRQNNSKSRGTKV